MEDLNDFVVKLKKGGMSPNTVLHNVIIIAQFFRRNGRPGIHEAPATSREDLSAPPRVHAGRAAKFLTACDEWERALFSTFLLTGFREQEVMYLFWGDVNLALRTIRVTSKPDLGFFQSAGKNGKYPCRGYFSQHHQRAPSDERKRLRCFPHRPANASRTCFFAVKRSLSKLALIQRSSI